MSVNSSKQIKLFLTFYRVSIETNRKNCMYIRSLVSVIHQKPKLISPKNSRFSLTSLLCFTALLKKLGILNFEQSTNYVQFPIRKDTVE